MKKRKIEPILDRLRQSAGTSKDAEVCKIFNIKPNTMDVWKQRDNIPEKTLQDIAIKNKINIDWLLDGNSDNFLNDNIISLPYYPEEYMSAGGGAYPSLVKSEPLSISVEFIKTVLGIDIYKGMFVMNVSGDSMEPSLRDRSLIVVNPIVNDTHIIKDGAVYAVQFGNMMLVKRVSYNPASKEFTLISDNPKYPPIIIKNHTDSQENLVFIGRIVGCFDRV